MDEVVQILEDLATMKNMLSSPDEDNHVNTLDNILPGETLELESVTDNLSEASENSDDQELNQSTREEYEYGNTYMEGNLNESVKQNDESDDNDHDDKNTTKDGEVPSSSNTSQSCTFLSVC